MIKNSIIKDYKKNGVVVLRDIISKKWINILKNGVKKNLKIQVNINVFMKKVITKNYFMMITVTGKK